MNKLTVTLAVSCMIVTGIIGIGIGYYMTPEYSLAMYDKTTMDLGRPDKWVDLRYINAMIEHHRGAMVVAAQAKISARPEVAKLAADILANEPKAIAELYQWKKEWYHDTRPVTDPAVVRLGTYDKNFDLRFLNAVIAHHQNGILMTKDIRLKSSRADILNNADGVEAFLSGGIDMLKGWRTQWYSI